jgi:glycosyltransferase involved in cell wall biosynthesis
MTTSLIIATYNWKEALELSLQSVLQQTVFPDEVIIADDGSREDTAALIQEYQKKIPVPLIHVWHEDHGFQLAQIRNKAVARSDKDYIIQIDGDIILHASFIEDHIKRAEENRYVKGSRVLLSEALSKQKLTEKNIHFGLFEKGLKNKLNAIHLPYLHFLFNAEIKDPFKIRGCNMAFWRKNFIQVNGYNEEISGWGREDSELVMRFINSGIYGKALKFGGIAYHIYHPENKKNNLHLNDEILESTIHQKLIRCNKGIDQYLS